MTQERALIDETLEDLYYIKRRFEKFLQRLSYWLTLKDLTEGESKDIAMYFSRIDDFRDEVKAQLYNRENSAEGHRDGTERTAIYPFYKALPNLRETNPKIEELCVDIETLLNRVDYTFSAQRDFRKRLYSNRGKLQTGEDHRSHHSREFKGGVRLRQRKGVQLPIEQVEMITAIVKSKNISFEDWLRDATSLKLYIDSRILGKKP